MRFLIFFLLAVTASAQLVPRLQLTGNFTSFAQANNARNVISNKLVSARSGLVHALDLPFRFSTNAGVVNVTSVEFFASTNLQNTAIRWMQTNQFGGSGWTVTISSHLCPGTNAVPAGWTGCALDSRAQSTNIVITP